MKCLSLFGAALVGAFFCSCSTTSQVSLDYVPSPGKVKPGQPEFSTRPFADRRDAAPTYLGTVRAQMGLPGEQVQTRLPIGEIVTNAFGYGLESRGMLTSPKAARYVVTGEVLDLYCQMLVHPYGYARVRVSVLESASGRIVFSHVYEGERQSGAVMPGSGSPVGLLGNLVSGALQDVVDRALDDSEMRARLNGSGLPQGAPGGAPQFVPGML